MPLILGVAIGVIALVGICAAGVVWLVSLVGGEKEWVLFVGPDKKFSVLMPGVPVTKDQPAPGLNAPMKVHMLDLRRKAFFISFVDIPPHELGNVPIDQRFAAARDGGLKNTPNSVLESEKVITFEKYPGRDIVYSIPNKGRFVMRLILVDNRMYILLVGGDTITAESADVTKFFASFKLLPPGGQGDAAPAPERDVGKKPGPGLIVAKNSPGKASIQPLWRRMKSLAASMVLWTRRGQVLMMHRFL